MGASLSADSYISGDELSESLSLVSGDFIGGLVCPEAVGDTEALSLSLRDSEASLSLGEEGTVLKVALSSSDSKKKSSTIFLLKNKKINIQKIMHY